MEDLPTFSANVVAYVAGFVTRKVSSTLSCDTCAERLHNSIEDNDSHLHHLINIRDFGGLIRPSDAVIRLCHATENVIRFIPTSNFVVRNLRDRIRQTVLNEGHLPFPDDHQSGLNSHAMQLAKLVIDTYCNVRMHHHAKIKTDDSKGAIIRSKLTKAIIFSHQ